MRLARRERVVLGLAVMWASSLWHLSALAQSELASFASPPAPTLGPWYVARRFELSGLSAVLLLALLGSVVHAGAGERLSSLGRKVRITCFALVLAFVSVWGYDVSERRSARRAWSRALHVAVVLLTDGRIDARASAKFMAEAAVANAFLLRERQSYHATATQPLWLHTFGPLVYTHDRPTPPPDDTLLARAQHQLELSRVVSEIDHAAKVPLDRFDVRLYVFARAPAAQNGPRFVEGFAQDQGDLGIIAVDLDDKMVGTAWTAVLHELLHTVGARDKYDERGRALIPVGLAEPDLVPVLPQRRAEIMAGDIPLAVGKQKLPNGFDELRVGPTTAREIGWVR